MRHFYRLFFHLNFISTLGELDVVVEVLGVGAVWSCPGVVDDGRSHLGLQDCALEPILFDFAVGVYLIVFAIIK